LLKPFVNWNSAVFVPEASFVSPKNATETCSPADARGSEAIAATNRQAKMAPKQASRMSKRLRVMANADTQRWAAAGVRLRPALTT